MEAGDYDEACPKLAESHRIDPAGGTLLNLGLCYEKAGKLASAWATFMDAFVLSREDGREDRAAFAEEHIKALRPRLSRVAILVPAGFRPDGLTVKLDGLRIEPPAWETSILLDSGDHYVEVSAPGYESWTGSVRIEGEGTTEKIAVPVLQLAQPAPVPPPAPQPKRAKPEPRMNRAMELPPASDSGTPVIGYVLVGTGVAAVGVGSYFGAKAFSSWSDRNDHCPGGRCDAEGVELGDETKRTATIANVAVGLGLVSAGIGTYFILTM